VNERKLRRMEKDWLHVPKVFELCQALREAQEENKRLRTKAIALINQLTVVHDSEAYRAVWHLNYSHFGGYTGPHYADELKALKEELEDK